jgi:hypothetical protein
MNETFNATVSISNTSIKANPLLSTYKNYNTVIQPYWLIITDFVVYDTVLRFSNKIFHGTFTTVGEDVLIDYPPKDYSPPPIIDVPITNPLSLPVPVIYVAVDYEKLEPETKKKSKNKKFDLFDIVTIITLFAHFIWYCQIQSSCTSFENNTVWDCYNLFGYRLYNYIFPSYGDFVNNYIGKLFQVLTSKKEKKTEVEEKSTCRNILDTLTLIIHYTGLYAGTFTLIIVGGSLVPYLFTHVGPMIYTYLFITLLYIAVFTIILTFLQFLIIAIRLRSGAKESTFFLRLHRIFTKGQMIVLHYSVRIFPHLVSFLYNYSQYTYYGENYFQSIVNDYNARDIQSYFESVRNETGLIAHAVLTVF